MLLKWYSFDEGNLGKAISLFLSLLATKFQGRNEDVTLPWSTYRAVSIAVISFQRLCTGLSGNEDCGLLLLR